MNGDTTISIALLISAISVIATLINTFAGGKKRQEEQIEAEKNRQMDIEKNFVKINVKLDEFCSQSRNLMAENAKKTDQLKAVSEKLILITEQVRQHETRITKLEENQK